MRMYGRRDGSVTEFAWTGARERTYEKRLIRAWDSYGYEVPINWEEFTESFIGLDEKVLADMITCQLKERQALLNDVIQMEHENYLLVSDLKHEIIRLKKERGF